MKQQGRRVAHLERMIDLAIGVAVIQRGDADTGLETRQIVDQELDPVGHERGEAITRFQSEREIAFGECIRFLFKFLPGQLPLMR